MSTHRCCTPARLAAIAAGLCLGAGAALATPDDGRTSLRIELRPDVQASQARLVLGDIAHLYSTDLGLVRRMVDLPVGHAPRAGDTVTVERGRLQQWVHARSGLRRDEVQWSGASELQVSTAARSLPGEQLAQVARTALRQHLESAVGAMGLPATRIELQPAAEPAEVSVPATTTRLAARSLGTAPPARKMLVWVDAFAGDRFVRAIPVRFEVSVFAKAPVATSALAAGNALDTASVQEREIDITLLHQGVWKPAPASPAAPSPQPTLRHGVAAGQPIPQALVQAAPAVSRGDWAKLVSNAGALTLESRVQVLQDAQLGQVVRVRQANGTGSILARVSAPGVLELQP